MEREQLELEKLRAPAEEVALKKTPSMKAAEQGETSSETSLDEIPNPGKPAESPGKKDLLETSSKKGSVLGKRCLSTIFKDKEEEWDEEAANRKGLKLFRLWQDAKEVAESNERLWLAHMARYYNTK